MKVFFVVLFFVCEGIFLGTLRADTLGSLKISEIRTDSLPPYTNVEYIELSGVAGTSLDGLSLVVVGRANANRSFVLNGGVVNAVVPLSGEIPEDRTYLVGNSWNMLFDQPDSPQGVGLDDLENLTILLVVGVPDFNPGMDLDLEDDGVLDDFPYVILDSIATQWQDVDSPNGGPVYSETVMGPNGGIVIFGATRCLATDEWTLLGYYYPGAGESPGDPNGWCLATICPGDLNDDGVCNGADLSIVLGAWGTFDGPYDFNQDGIVDASDVSMLLQQWGACDL